MIHTRHNVKEMSEVIEAAETEPETGEYAPDFLRTVAMSLEFYGDKMYAARLKAYADNLEAKRSAWIDARCDVCYEHPDPKDHVRPCGNCTDPGHAAWECVLPVPEVKP